MSRPAAIFDLDGTLIPNTSAERTFFWFLLRTGVLSPWNVFQMAIAAWSAGGNLHAMTRGNKIYIRHKPVQRFRDIAREYFEPRIDKMVFPGMRRVIEDHRRSGEMLLLLTGSLDVVAECFVRHLHMDGFQAAMLQTHSGYCTGRIDGILPYGIGKLEVLRNLRQRYDIDPNASYMYANVYSDRYVMNAVEYPVAVNPDRRLRSYAQRHRWKILDVKMHESHRLKKI